MRVARSPEHGEVAVAVWRSLGVAVAACCWRAVRKTGCTLPQRPRCLLLLLLLLLLSAVCCCCCCCWGGRVTGDTQACQ